MDLSGLRSDYESEDLSESSFSPSPILELEKWLLEAMRQNVIEPHAMTVSTVSAAGKPSSRVVLLRELNQNGLVFFTNYQSRKGQDLEQNPNAAVNFYWPTLIRQVRVEGQIVKTSDEESDKYFSTRPYASQISSAASHQSREMAVLQNYLSEMEVLKQTYPNEVPRPSHWGGYRLIPEYFEFWIGRPNRTHSRFRFQLEAGNWAISRLYP